MREIRFRVWHKPTQLMDEVVLIDFYNEKIGILYADPVMQCESIQKYNFNEVKLMQYTGLKDKNGVEIYGSDIVLMYGEDKFIVHFDYDKACYFLWSTTDMNDVVYFGDFALSDVEVIGNIHDNPELLEQII